MKKWCLLCLCLVLLLGSMTACKKKAADETSAPASSDSTKRTLPPAEDNGSDLVWDNDGMTPATTTTTKKSGENSNSNAGKPATTTTTPVKEESGILLPAEGSKPLPETDQGYQWLELGRSSHSNGVASIVVKNASKGWETEQTKSFISYACYDKDGKVLKEDKANFGRVNPGESVTVQITMPSGTVKLAVTGAETEFWTHGWH